MPQDMFFTNTSCGPGSPNVISRISNFFSLSAPRKKFPFIFSPFRRLRGLSCLLFSERLLSANLFAFRQPPRVYTYFFQECGLQNTNISFTVIQKRPLRVFSQRAFLNHLYLIYYSVLPFRVNTGICCSGASTETL